MKDKIINSYKYRIRCYNHFFAAYRKQKEVQVCSLVLDEKIKRCKGLIKLCERAIKDIELVCNDIKKKTICNLEVWRGFKK